MSQNVHKKLLDKSVKMWYNMYVKKRSDVNGKENPHRT